MSDSTTPQNKVLRMPPTLLLLTIVLLCAAMATKIIKPGEFDRVDKVIRQAGKTQIDYTVAEGDTIESIIANVGDDSTKPKNIYNVETGKPVETLAPGMALKVTVHQTETRSVVDRESFRFLERAKNGGIGWELWSIIRMVTEAPMKGFSDKSGVIAFILILGGAFGMIMATGAIDSGLRSLVAFMSARRQDWLLLPVLMFVFSFGGAIFGMSEEVIPFALITIPLALRLGYDSITGLCMSYVGAHLGFTAAFFNPFTVGVAQGIAELPPTSGIGYRLFLFVVVTSVGVAYAMWWANKVKKNPEISPTYENDKKLIHKFEAPDHTAHGFTGKHAAVLAIVLGAVVLTGYGVARYHWYLNELGAVFLGAGIVCAIIGGLRMELAASSFVKGASDLVGASLIVAFAAGIKIVMEEGQILDTILNAIANSMEGTHDIVSAILMFIFQTLLNFLVPSGSGQAAMTMPIMAPLSDVLGLERQVAVLAFQFGDGFSNMIIPTSAVLMSVLGIAEIPWEKWVKWILPLQAILFVVGCLALAAAVMMGYK